MAADWHVSAIERKIYPCYNSNAYSFHFFSTRKKRCFFVPRQSADIQKVLICTYSCTYSKRISINVFYTYTLRTNIPKKRSYPMKTRNEIYNNGEAAALVKMITDYHALTYEQVLRTFPHKQESIRILISNLIKQGRFYYEPEQNLLCDQPDMADVDHAMIRAYWVLLDFKEAIVYHTSGDFPVKIHFFSHDEAYEIIYIPLGQEIMMNQILMQTRTDANRLVIVESKEQAARMQFSNILAFCLVDSDGEVSYYRKGK